MGNLMKLFVTSPALATAALPNDLRRRRFWIAHVVIPLLITMLLFFATEFSDLDLRVSHWIYNTGGGNFYNNWFLMDVMHEGARAAGRGLAYLLLLALLGSFLSPRFKHARMPLAFLVISIALGSSMTVKLKHITDVYCPHSLEIFGGSKPIHSPFDISSWNSDARGGECWPGGHSAFGFAMWAFYFVAREFRRAWALPALLAVFAYGNILGSVRVIQGAHFLTHQWWTACLCWFITVFFYVLLLRRDLLPFWRRILAGTVTQRSSLQGGL